MMSDEIKPVAWITKESLFRLGKGKPSVPVHCHESGPAHIPLYTQSAIDQATEELRQRVKELEEVLNMVLEVCPVYYPDSTPVLSDELSELCQKLLGDK